MNLSKFAALTLAHDDASGDYEPEHLSKIATLVANLGDGSKLAQTHLSNLAGVAPTLTEAMKTMGCPSTEALAQIYNTKIAAMTDEERREKVSSIVGGALTALPSGLISAYQGRGFLPGAFGGFIAGDRYGVKGGLAGLAGQYALGPALGPKGTTGPLGKFIAQAAYNPASGKTPASYDETKMRLLRDASSVAAPIAAGALTDAVLGDD